MNDVSHKKIVQEYYSKRARDYDRQKARTWKSETGFRDSIISDVVEALAGLENKSVLEVGVGSGRIGFPLLGKIAAWFVGLDLSREMLKLAKKRMPLYKQKFDLILGDAEHLPFVNGVFNAIICMSTMHYFAIPERSLTEFSRTLKEKGIFIYGDLTMHELDNRSFLDTLEKTISKAHAKYYKPSEMKNLLENHGFCISKMEIFPYRKSYIALMEDKGRYFDVKPEALHECIRRATLDEKRLYFLGKDKLTLFYALMIALKENKSQWFDA